MVGFASSTKYSVIDEFRISFNFLTFLKSARHKEKFREHSVCSCCFENTQHNASASMFVTRVMYTMFWLISCSSTFQWYRRLF